MVSRQPPWHDALQRDRMHAVNNTSSSLFLSDHVVTPLPVALQRKCMRPRHLPSFLSDHVVGSAAAGGGGGGRLVASDSAISLSNT